MKNIEIYNTLNIDKESSSIVATFTQEDDAIMEFKLYKDGQEIILKDQIITLGAQRKDGAIIEQNEKESFVVKEDNVLNITLKKNIIAVPGIVKIQLYLKDTTGEMASSTFSIMVNKKILGAENVEATNDIKTLNTLVLELKNNTNKLIDDTKAKADKLLNGLQEIGDNLSSTVKTTTDKLIENTKVEVDNIKKDYEGLRKVVIDENIGIKLQNELTELQNGLKTNQFLEYANKSSYSIENSLEGKTTDMVIKGRTLQNLAKQEKFVDNTINQPSSQHKYYTWNGTKNLYSQGEYTLKNISGYSLVWDVRNKADDKWIRSVMSNKSNTVTLADNEWIANIQATENNGVPIDSNTQKLLQENCVILKGNCLDFIDEIPYFEGIKSFGEAEENKISILSKGKNLFNKNQFSKYLNNEGILEFTSDSNERVNNYFYIYTEKKWDAKIIMNGYDSSAKQFTTVD